MLMITVSKAREVAFLMANFAAGYAKTVHSTYIERHRNK